MPRQSQHSTVIQVVDGHRRLFIDTRWTDIDFIVRLVDGLTTWQLPGHHKRAYMQAEDVIAWHEKELTYQPNRKNSRKIIDNLKECVAQLATGAERVLVTYSTGGHGKPDKKPAKKSKTKIR